MDDEQQGDSVFEPVGRAAVDAAQAAAAEIGTFFGDGGAEGPGAAIGRAAADIFDSPRDPASDVDDGVGSSPEKTAEEIWEAGSGNATADNPDWAPIDGAGGRPVDETPPTGTFPDETPYGELPPDAETFVSR